MPKNDLKSRSALEQNPVSKVRHKRRSEDELRKALHDYAEGKALLRDDERRETLEDGIVELIELRRILMNTQQKLGALSQETTQAIGSILSPQ